MSYPKDPYYEKTPVAAGTGPYGSGPNQSGQYPPPAYPTAPPPYSAVAPAMLPYQSGQYTYGAGVHPQPQSYPSGNMMTSAPPPYSSYGQPTYDPGYPVQQNFTYSAPPIAVAQFDAGARFDGIAAQNIPPPPPGCAPNAAQLAAAQGGTVLATQKKASWFSGTGGGVTLW